MKEILDAILRFEDPRQFKEENDKLLKGSGFFLGQKPFDVVAFFKELLILSILGRENDVKTYGKSTYLTFLQFKVLYQMLPAVTDFSRNNPGHRIALTLRALVLNALMSAEQESLLSDYISAYLREGITDEFELKTIMIDLMTRRLPAYLNKHIPFGDLLEIVEELSLKDPQNPIALRIKVETLIRLNRPKEAMTNAEELMERNRDDEIASVLLAGCKLMNNDAYSALQICNAQLEIKPNNLGAWFGKIISTFLVTGNQVDALGVALEGNDRFPNQNIFQILVTLLTNMN